MSMEVEICFPHSSPNSKCVSSHKAGYVQGHSFTASVPPTSLCCKSVKSHICAVIPLQPNVHTCLPAPVTCCYSLLTRSADVQHLQPFHYQANDRVMTMLEKQRSVLPAQLKNDLTDRVYLSSKLLSHCPFPARKEQ